MISRREERMLREREPKFEDTLLSLIATGRQPKGIIREARKIIAIARKFNDEVARPASLVIDRKGLEDHRYLPWEYVKKANEYKLYTLFLPKMFGGQGYSPACSCYFMEELAATCLGMSNIVGAHYLGLTILLSTWNMKIAARICREVVEGEKSGSPCILTLAMTEPNAGTDSQNVEFMDKGGLGCHARRVDGGYVINGNKIFITMGHVSTWHIVQAYTALDKASETMVTFAVKTGQKGFSFGKQEKKMGQKGSVASELIFDECFIPDDQVCLDTEQAASLRRNIKETNEQLFAYIWSASRAGVGALGVGAARGAFETALDFASNHTIDGERMINHGWCQSMLAEMYKNVAAGRSLYSEANFANGMYGLLKLMNFKSIYYTNRFIPKAILLKLFSWICEKKAATWLFRLIYLDFQEDAEIDRVDGWGSMAKFAGSDAGAANCRMALELMGQAGVRHDRRAEKMMRDAKLLQIYEGTNQINRLNLFKRLVARSYEDVHTFSSSTR